MTPAFMQTIFYWGTWYLIRNDNINKCYDDREVRLRVLVACSQTHCLPLPDVVDHPRRWPPSVPFLLVPTWQYPFRRWVYFSIWLNVSQLVTALFWRSKNTMEVILKARSHVVLDLPPGFLEMLALGTFLLGIQPLFCEKPKFHGEHMVDSTAATRLYLYERSQVSPANPQNDQR